uniref:Zinc finger protein 277 n=1 Tax=Neovison vison TaxID=452646 RepID=A0A8C7ARE9_NEOVI
MAAPETQGAAAGGEEDCEGNHSKVAGVSYEDSKDCILEPLSLPESPGGITALEGSPSVPCIFCEEHFPMDEQDKLLKHMIIEHKMVIADVKLVADFQRKKFWNNSSKKEVITIFTVFVCFAMKNFSGTDLFF